MKTITLAILLLTSNPLSARSELIRTSIGDREVTFQMVQKHKKFLLQTVSNELSRAPVEMNPANQQYFTESLKTACNKPEFEVGCARYAIEIERDVRGNKIRCHYCYNSTSGKAKEARKTLSVLSIAVNTAE